MTAVSGSRKIGYVTVLMCAVCWGQSEKQFVILPSSEAQAVTHLCSRTGPEHVAGGWTPSESDIANVEKRLVDVSKMQRPGQQEAIPEPRSFRRQYVGIIVDGKHLIYLNAFPTEAAERNWRTHFTDVCDGGSAFWGVIFDPTSGQFSDLRTNGIA